MSTSYHSHVLFESAVYAAFPIRPVPQADGIGDKYAFQHSARDLLSGKTWPEVIGCRLHYGELDLSLSIWMKALPLEVFAYYLPSHLIFASILMATGSGREHPPCSLMEALILPTGDDIAALKELDSELYLEAPVSENAAQRIALYEKLNGAQRACVADYLSLYLENHEADFSARGTEVYLHNRDIWKSLAVSAETDA